MCGDRHSTLSWRLDLGKTDNGGNDIMYGKYVTAVMKRGMAVNNGRRRRSLPALHALLTLLILLFTRRRKENQRMAVDVLRY